MTANAPRIAAYFSAFAVTLGIIGPTAAFPEPMANFAPGVFVKITRDYDDIAGRFTNTPPKGEGDACFQITNVDDQGVHMTLISGHYHPWWSDAVIPPGTSDIWSNSAAYMEKHPNAAPLDLIRQMFTTVDGCPVA